ncbi:hypothetical protein D3C71_1612070 [compost metagenome]
MVRAGIPHVVTEQLLPVIDSATREKHVHVTLNRSLSSIMGIWLRVRIGRSGTSMRPPVIEHSWHMPDARTIGYAAQDQVIVLRAITLTIQAPLPLDQTALETDQMTKIHLRHEQIMVPVWLEIRVP